MSAPVLTTKLYIPPPRLKAVPRPRLIERLNDALQRPSGVTLISAPAGFGKTALVSEWIATLTPSPLPPVSAKQRDGWPLGEGLGARVAWLSLDEGANEQKRLKRVFSARVYSKTVGRAQGG